MSKDKNVLKELAVKGTHDKVIDLILRHACPPGNALDLGAGTGVLEERISSIGFDTLSVDNDEQLYASNLPFMNLDLNDYSFGSKLLSVFDVVTAVEVIEHLESPIAFLRNIRYLLKANGIALVTTPNVENVPARLKFFLTGKLRMMDKMAPWHISPIFYDLFVRQYLPMAGLRLIEYEVYPYNDYPQTSRRWLISLFKLFAMVLKGPSLMGDTIVFILKRDK